MPLRRTVRKLSSKSAIDTPILAASAELDMSPNRPAARKSFFISVLPLERPVALRDQPDFPVGELLQAAFLRAVQVLAPEIERLEHLENYWIEYSISARSQYFMQRRRT